MPGKSQETIKKSKHLKKIFSINSKFILGVANIDQLPESNLPEVAFAGRSNVGKSSLFNAVTQRKSLAYTSITPGRTQEINFFDINNKLIIADLPGYGFAKASKSKISEWTKLVNTYLKYRSQLSRVYILVDSRHGLKTNDYKTMKKFQEIALGFQVVLTKCDKVRADALKETASTVKDKISNYTTAHPEIIITSAKKNIGVDELRFFLSELI